MSTLHIHLCGLQHLLKESAFSRSALCCCLCCASRASASQMKRLNRSRSSRSSSATCALLRAASHVELSTPSSAHTHPLLPGIHLPLHLFHRQPLLLLLPSLCTLRQASHDRANACLLSLQVNQANDHQVSRTHRSLSTTFFGLR
jgi:hypothetical protein